MENTNLKGRRKALHHKSNSNYEKIVGGKMEPIASKTTKLSECRIHLSLKGKLDNYDLVVERTMDPKKYIVRHGIILDGNKKPEFTFLSKRFECMKKWSIQDYIEYYYYVVSKCRTIEGYRGNSIVRLTDKNITSEEIESLLKVTKGLNKIEEIVSEYFLKSNITYEELIGDLDIDMPLSFLDGMCDSNSIFKTTFGILE